MTQDKINLDGTLLTSKYQLNKSIVRKSIYFVITGVHSDILVRGRPWPICIVNHDVLMCALYIPAEDVL